MEEITTASNAVPNKPPKRKKSRGRDGKWYHFHFLTFTELDQWKVKNFSKKDYDPLDYDKDFRYDQSAIDIEGIVQSIPEHESREEIMATLREAIEDKLKAIALIEAVLAEVTKWDWEEVKGFWGRLLQDGGQDQDWRSAMITAIVIAVVYIAFLVVSLRAPS